MILTVVDLLGKNIQFININKLSSLNVYKIKDDRGHVAVSAIQKLLDGFT